MNHYNKYSPILLHVISSHVVSVCPVSDSIQCASCHSHFFISLEQSIPHAAIIFLRHRMTWGKNLTDQRFEL